MSLRSTPKFARPKEEYKSLDGKHMDKCFQRHVETIINATYQHIGYSYKKCIGFKLSFKPCWKDTVWINVMKRTDRAPDNWVAAISGVNWQPGCAFSIATRTRDLKLKLLGSPNDVLPESITDAQLEQVRLYVHDYKQWLQQYGPRAAKKRQANDDSYEEDSEDDDTSDGGEAGEDEDYDPDVEEEEECDDESEEESDDDSEEESDGKEESEEEEEGQMTESEQDEEAESEEGKADVMHGHEAGDADDGVGSNARKRQRCR